jgi:hypothetical protein
VKMELTPEGLIELEAPSDKRLDQSIPGARWSGAKGLWVLPLSWAACTVARTVLGDDLEVGPELAAWAHDEYERRVLPASVARESEDGPPWEPAKAGDPADSLGTEPTGEPLSDSEWHENPQGQWWWDIWRGMPEYLHQDVSPWKKILVSFRSPADFEEFARIIGQKIGPRTPSIWFPKLENLHEIDWRYADDDDLPTDTPSSPDQIRRAAKLAKAKSTSGISDAFAAVLENLA